MPWSRLKRLWRDWTTPFGAAESAANAAARERLQALREDELSVGASMRRGGPVSQAPGQLRSSTRVVKARGQHGPATTDAGSDASPGDFATSSVTAAATGSAVLGYAIGGSLFGAAAGALVHNALTDCAPDASSDCTFSD